MPARTLRDTDSYVEGARFSTGCCVLYAARCLNALPVRVPADGRYFDVFILGEPALLPGVFPVQGGRVL